MRLIDTSTLRLVTKNDSEIPTYAILSHTWGSDEDEVSFQDLEELSNSRLRHPKGLFTHPVSKKPRFGKIRDSAELARSQGYAFIWVDTCCINKTSSAELSEAINSMFGWYRNASICYAYLNDFGNESLVYGASSERKFRRCRWFTRGWTLQELIAPPEVSFYSQNWTLIGFKTGKAMNATSAPSAVADRFPKLLSSVTGVDLGVLTGSIDLEELSVSNRMKWAASRYTTRIEDKAYCLMGIFSVNMPLLYGEGSRAFIRLQEEILKASNDQSIFTWKCPEFDRLRYQLSGLLVSDPSYFEYSPRLRPIQQDMSRASAPSTMTNLGLHINMYLKLSQPLDGLGARPDQESAECYAVLDCAPYSSSEGRGLESYHSAAIRLASLGGDQYSRVNPETIFSIPSSKIMSRHEGDGYRYIYVRQLPTYSFPDILVGGDPFLSKSETPLNLIEVYPSSNWSRQTLTLKVSTSGTTSILGAFRYNYEVRGVERFPTLAVDLFVGLSPGYQGSRSRHFWCYQQPTTQFQSLAEVVNEFESQRNKGLTPRLLGTHAYENVMATVETTRINSKTTIMLRFSEVHMMHSSREEPWLLESYRRNAHELDATADSQAGFQADSQNLQHGTSLPFSSARVALGRLVTEDSWDLSLGDMIPPTGNLGLPPTTIRVSRSEAAGTSREPGTVQPSFRDILDLAITREVTADTDQRVSTTTTPFESYFSTLLVKACIKNDVKAVSELLDSPLSTAIVSVDSSIKAEDDSEIWATIFRKFKPVHWASALGFVQILGVLLSHGAEIQSTTATGLSSFHLALLMGHMDVLDLLLQAEKTSDHETELAIESYQRESLGHLTAAYVKQSRRARQLLEHFLAKPTTTPDSSSSRVWVNTARNSLRETPLHRAAAMNNQAAAKAILDLVKPIDIDAVDSQGRTPLWHAAAAKAPEIVDLLLKHGANPNRSDQMGRKPMHVACRQGHEGIVQALFRAGADTSPSISISPLFFAALSGNASIISALLKRGADPDAGVWVSYTGDQLRPVYMACANGWLDCVRVLCSAGCIVHMMPSEVIIIDKGRAEGIRLESTRYSNPVRGDVLVLAVEFRQREIFDYLKGLPMFANWESPFNLGHANNSWINRMDE